MKVICTTDFSVASINAIDWVYNMLQDSEGGEIEILHCVDSLQRSDMFLSIDDILKDQAIKDMEKLEKKFFKKNDLVSIKTSVHKANSKTFIPQYAKSKGADLIVTGTTGLSNVKDILVGSVTSYLTKHSDIPLLTIPATCKYKYINTAVIGLGKEEMGNPKSLQFMYDFLYPFNPRVYLAQVIKPGRHQVAMDYRIEEYLKDLTFEFSLVEHDGNINSSLNNFCEDVEADMLCMIHYKRHWIERLVHQSVTKQELFDLEKPLLIIPD